MHDIVKTFKLSKGERPQVLLLGNGINRACGNDSWDDFLDRIKDKNKYPKVANEYCLPMPLKGTLLTNGDIGGRIKTSLIDKDEYSFCTTPKLEKILKEIVSCNFDYIITTNYTYEIEASIQGLNREQQLLKYQMSYLKKAENKFLLHTFYKLNNQNENVDIWHIHGEMRKPGSIIANHSDYCKLVSRYIEELKNRKYCQQKHFDDEVQIESWIDAFILGDVYSVGFGLDYSEMDMWWMLHRKNKENNPHKGKFIFYELERPALGKCQYDSKCKLANEQGTKKQEKKELLSIFNITTETSGCILSESENNNREYYEFYWNCTSNIKERIAAARGEKNEK